MSGPRDRIFAGIERALGPRESKPGDIASELDRMLGDPSAVQPKFDRDALEDRFVAKATSERVTATLDRIGDLSDLPRAVAAYADEARLPRCVAVQPTDRLTRLDWSGIETHGAPAADEAVALTLAEYGIAETGSVVFRSRADAPTLFNFLPLHHVVALETRRIVPCLEDLWIAMAEDHDAQPRSINIVTGTSGTADIEAKNVRGAHGPRHMRIVLIEG